MEIFLKFRKTCVKKNVCCYNLFAKVDILYVRLYLFNEKNLPLSDNKDEGCLIDLEKFSAENDRFENV